MKVYTFSEARGRAFIIQPVKETSSPLAVSGLNLKITRSEIVDFVRESRESR